MEGHVVIPTKRGELEINVGRSEQFTDDLFDSKEAAREFVAAASKRGRPRQTSTGAWAVVWEPETSGKGETA